MQSTKYCFNCGKQISHLAEICPQCGVRQPGKFSNTNEEWLITLLLCIFLGPLGVHRFYTGHILIGIVQLLTAGGCGVWYLIDLIMIITGSYTKESGEQLKP